MVEPTVALTGSPGWADEVEALLRQRGFALARYEGRAGYITRLAEERAAMVLVDGDAPGGWRFWAITPRASAATRRVPVLVVSTDSATRRAALAAGADACLSPGELLSRLPGYLAQLARVPTPAYKARLADQCRRPLPPLARQGVEKFNTGQYYQQHDLFEEQWMAEEGPVRDLYRAILQVGIAYYQITRGNYRGALKMLRRSLQWLLVLPDVCQGVDVRRLREDAAHVRVALEDMSPDSDQSFELSLLKPIRLVGEQ